MHRQHWYLILQFALKDFKIRYTHSALGYAWSVMNPLFFTVLYYFVFSMFIRFDVPNYPGYLIIGIVMWQFFADGSSTGIASLLAQAAIVTKVALPRHLVVYAAILNALMTLVITMAVVGVVLLVTGTRLTIASLALPLVIGNLVLLTLGVSLLLSPLHVRFHDIGYLWGLAIQVGFWLTPIIYSDFMLPQRARDMLRFNPMARIIGHARDVLIYGRWPDWVAMGRTTLISAAVLLVGTLVFRRLQARLVEYY